MADAYKSERVKAIPWGVVLAIASAVSLAGFVYYYSYNREITGERARLIKERQALAAEIAEDLGTLRGKLEPWTVALATGPFAGDLVDPDARSLSWRERPVVYLRVRAGDATSNEAVQAAAKLTSLDGLSACLIRTKGAGPWAYGEIIARATMLGSDFIRDVKETKNDLRLRNLTYALDQFKQKDFPIARDAARQAEYAVIVVDEDPAQVPATSPAFGGDASVHQKILGTVHAIRMSVRRIGDGREYLRLRRTPEATLIHAAGDATAMAAGLEVRRIQALGCAMANEALALAGQKGGTELAANPPPLPALIVPAPSASASGSASAAASGSVSAAPSVSASK